MFRADYVQKEVILCFLYSCGIVLFQKWKWITTFGAHSDVNLQNCVSADYTIAQVSILTLHKCDANVRNIGRQKINKCRISIKYSYAEKPVSARRLFLCFKYNYEWPFDSGINCII